MPGEESPVFLGEAVLRLLRVLAHNRMLTPKYAQLGLRFLRRRFLTLAGWRWERLACRRVDVHWSCTRVTSRRQTGRWFAHSEDTS